MSSCFFGRLSRGLAVWSLVYGAAACEGKDVASDSKAECAGRMQIQLPGEAEIAAQTAQSWILSGTKNGLGTMRFTDGELAGGSFVNPFTISHRLNASEMGAAIKHSELTQARFDSLVKVSIWSAASFHSSRTTVWPGVTWSHKDKPGPNARYRQKFLVNVDQHLVEWGSSVPEFEATSLSTRVTSVLNNITPRPTHTVPSEPGLCYPYLFIKDHGQEKREVSTTYRLKDQPDITVLLQDKTAMPRLKNERSQYDAAKVQSSAFWTNYYPSSEEKVLSIWSDRFRSTKLAGYDGVESYVRITRASGAVDYGYYVSVRGSAEAKDDEPDMTLYVIRDSNVAKAKGVQPYGDEQSLLALAKSIAASVKRRPTQ